ncbi:transcriptional regulator, MucR family [Tistlia consotensis]|uniref:Transcriptional regulator, MucR family n=1 Tax=Tistlia consotensis USBA 355 TaxID=560819 RepID=A0A1Y6BQ07_9PROT|nr:MucR family transcriptional regulator [Tistlia consotensis]SMF21332.1 transcriptional regulator, MucR family [Tistlia consotensis USBA 355]SNR47013.1 transcriptional regulator, MucR family [Tistlia consotensis]
MDDRPDEAKNDDGLLALTADVVVAYLKNNPVPSADVPSIIASVHAALKSLDGSTAETPEEKPTPAVPVRRSITPEYLICLEDGRKLKTLKRHLRAAYNMTPEEYRAKWGLPADYPMVAPNYAKQRSEFARKIGLGTANAGAIKKGGRRKKSG